MYAALLKWKKEPVQYLLEIRDCSLSIESFDKLIEDCGLTATSSTFYFINPIYSMKFGLKGRKLSPLIRRLPYVRNYFTTTAYYLVADASLCHAELVTKRNSEVQ